MDIQQHNKTKSTKGARRLLLLVLSWCCWCVATKLNHKQPHKQRVLLCQLPSLAVAVPVAALSHTALCTSVSHTLTASPHLGSPAIKHATAPWKLCDPCCVTSKKQTLHGTTRFVCLVHRTAAILWSAPLQDSGTHQPLTTHPMPKQQEWQSCSNAPRPVPFCCGLHVRVRCAVRLAAKPECSLALGPEFGVDVLLASGGTTALGCVLGHEHPITPGLLKRNSCSLTHKPGKMLTPSRKQHCCKTRAIHHNTVNADGEQLGAQVQLDCL